MNHSIAVTAGGHLYSWGKGEHGVLGHGNSQFKLFPQKVVEFDNHLKNNSRIVKIDAADDYTAVKMSDGQLLVFGKNDRGQLGRGGGDGLAMVSSENYPVPVIDSQFETFYVKDFHCGQLDMIIKGENDKIYLCGK